MHLLILFFCNYSNIKFLFLFSLPHTYTRGLYFYGACGASIDFPTPFFIAFKRRFRLQVPSIIKMYFEGIAANTSRLLSFAIFITHTIDLGYTCSSSKTPPVFLDLYLNRRRFAWTYFPLQIVQLNRWITHKYSRRSTVGHIYTYIFVYFFGVEIGSNDTNVKRYVGIYSFNSPSVCKLTCYHVDTYPKSDNIRHCFYMYALHW